MNKTHYITLILCLCMTGLFAQTKKEKKAQKEAVALQKYEDNKKLVASKSFEYEARWANPQQGRRIDLMGNANYVKIQGDSISAFLPYFGVVHSGGGYGGGGGIEIDNIMKDYEVEHNDKKKRIRIEFSARSESENFDFTIVISGENSVTIHVLGNSRSTISYDGSMSAIEEKEVKEE